jgi:predicted RNase H-like nuclease (RuvC/YqgF family)
MTDHTDLIARLRAPVPTVYDCKDAADALEAKDRRISELEKMLAVHRLAVDVDALKARIEELKAENKKLRTELDWAKYCYDDLRAALEKKND